MYSSREYDYSFYVSFAGSTKVGKTSLCNRITKTTPFRWNDKYDPTIGADSWCKYENIDEKKIRVYFYDTSGQERFKPVIRPYLSTRVDAIFLVYDLTDRKSFEDVRGWSNLIRENIEKNISIILVGNKCDMEAERQVSYEEGRDLAEDLEMKFIETSAKTTEGVMHAFKLLLREKMQQVEGTSPSNILHLKSKIDPTDKTSSKCA